MARAAALTALASLGLSGAPFHEPFHADSRQRSMIVTKRSDRDVIIAMPQLDEMAGDTGDAPPCLPYLPYLPDCRIRTYGIKAAHARPG